MARRQDTPGEGIVSEMTVVSCDAAGSLIYTYGGPLVIRAVEVTAKDTSGATLTWETSVEDAPRVGDVVTVAMPVPCSPEHDTHPI